MIITLKNFKKLKLIPKKCTEDKRETEEKKDMKL